tara:strand:- start:148 stop:633 length:486 start_codon:yes stop_codon:yes gene_type:complete
MTILLIMSRLITDIPNFTPTIALVIFTGYFIKNRYTVLLIILISQGISDFYIGLHDSMLFIYFSFLLIAFISPLVIKKLNLSSVITASLIGPVIFFIISNFGVWYSMNIYSNDMRGLIECYLAGVPFFDETLISTLLFSITIYVINKILLKNLINLSFSKR